jgi:hypothetical protein
MKEVIVYESCPEKKPLSGFSKFISISPKQLSQNHDQNQEKWKPEKWCSEMASILPTADTCEKNERGFCSSSRYREKPLSVFQNSFWFGSKNTLGNRWSKLAKNGFFLFWGKVVLEGGSGFRTPPGVVSGITY